MRKHFFVTSNICFFYKKMFKICYGIDHMQHTKTQKHFYILIETWASQLNANITIEGSKPIYILKDLQENLRQLKTFKASLTWNFITGNETHPYAQGSQSSEIKILLQCSWPIFFYQSGRNCHTSFIQKGRAWDGMLL